MKSVKKIAAIGLASLLSTAAWANASTPPAICPCADVIKMTSSGWQVTEDQYGQVRIQGQNNYDTTQVWTIVYDGYLTFESFLQQLENKKSIPVVQGDLWVCTYTLAQHSLLTIKATTPVESQK